MPNAAEIFHRSYVPEALTSCWLWHGPAAGPRATHVYGFIGRTRAHRLSWELHCGPIPEGMEVCHRCDVPLCVNPTHLFVGTHYENMQDRNRKGRTTKGNGFSSTKLTESAVKEILASAENHRVMAARFGVDFRTISQVRKRQIWAHVEGERSDDWRAHLARRGTAHKCSKLTEDAIPRIRERAAAGEIHKKIAQSYGVSRALISAVVRREVWTHV